MPAIDDLRRLLGWFNFRAAGGPDKWQLEHEGLRDKFKEYQESLHKQAVEAKERKQREKARKARAEAEARANGRAVEENPATQEANEKEG